MIPLIEYNKPTITGRIYQKGCFTNLEKVKDFFILEKPKWKHEDNSIASYDFTFETDESKVMLELEFVTLDRYGEGFVLNKPHFISPGVPLREGD